MGKEDHVKFLSARPFVIALVGLCVLAPGAALAQQFNSDNYLSKPHGVATMIFTVGQRTTMWMSTLSLFPNWEFTAAAFLYNKDDQRITGEGYSTSFYAKWMLHENKEKTGGFAVKFGVGANPSYVLNGTGYQDPSASLWMNAPLTIPFFGWRVSWDIMPGVSKSNIYHEDGTKEAAWAFTYSTRVAWYPVNPKWAVVGEVYGAAGEASLTPEFKAGIRWEPSVYANIAFTYDHKFDGAKGDGFEIGLMIFTPPFLKL